MTKRPLLLPLTPLYGAAVRFKNTLYDFGALKTRSLARPVISVGSISAGGAGKTPFVAMLGDLLARHAIRCDVLSRGYGRSLDTVAEVNPDGVAEEFGDEPLELARAGLAVFVGADRFAAGSLAERQGSAQVHLLDDGFGHRRLHRDLEIVLLTREDAEDHLLPAGNLREPLGSLPRADIIALREDEAAELTPLVQRHSGAEIWLLHRELTLPAGATQTPLAFCGIARAGDFFENLRRAGCNPRSTEVFPDHHAYAPADLQRLVRVAKRAGADGFCTTAKDAVKLSSEMMRTLEQVGPVVIPELGVSLLDEDCAMSRILHALQQAAAPA